MDMTVIRSIVTVTLFVLFILLCLMVWSGRRRAEFEAAARMPLEDSAIDTGTAKNAAGERH